MKRCLLPVLCVLLLLPVLGVRAAETELRVAPASEGRTVMEAGLEALGLSIAPYEVTDENWNQRGLIRYDMYAPTSPFAAHQLVDDRGRLMGSAFFFSAYRATEEEKAWAQEHLRDLRTLTMRTIYPDLSDEQAAELLDRMENTLKEDPYYPEILRGEARLGDYGFSLVLEGEKHQSSYLQVSYWGDDWPKAP